jgi:MOSC domain-containing protein YiiM
MTTAGRVELVSIALPTPLVVGDKKLFSGIRKRPQDGPVEVLEGGLSGDGVGDLKHHGGPNRAIHLFSAEHYDAFSPRPETAAAPPWVGENLTVRGYTDALAHIGDRVRVGTALLQVTMPTERCGHPGLSSGVPELRKWMIESLRTGFYSSVIEPGVLERGDALEVVERINEKWSIEALSAVMYRHVADPEIIAEVEQLEELAPEWKAKVRKLHRRSS